MARVLVAGFQHETNTFGATKAHYEDFLVADSWPPLLTGDDVLSGTRGINLPVAGFVKAAEADPDVTLVPALWCFAEPSSYVTDDAFERIAGMLLDAIAGAGEIDAIYLDLHGAMVTESHEDGEGELLARIRSKVGDDIPIAVSLDLHANISARMVRHAASLTIFRTYPHIDMDETGRRAFAMLKRHLEGPPLRKAFRQVPFLIPLTAQYTGAPPCRDLYGMLPQDPSNGPAADIALGFPAADIADVGPSVVAFATDQSVADRLADTVLAAIENAEDAFDPGLLPPEEAVRQAMAAPPGKPVVIADVQDNPGAGATADTTGLLSALVADGAQGAVLAMLNDPENAALAHTLGVGAEFEADLGGNSHLPGLRPYHGRFAVEALGGDRFAFTGEMYRGATAEAGPTVLLRVLDTAADVRVIVGSKRCQCLDRAVFTHIGVDPAAQRILAVKSTIHFRADFEPIADLILYAEAPGANPCRLDNIPYRRLRPGVRRGVSSG